MKRIILESPYAGDVIEHTIYARRAVKDCLSYGEAPIASHLLFTQPGVLNDTVPEQRRLGIAAGLAWLVVADAMVLYTDYGISPGMHNAMDAAAKSGVKVFTRSIGKNP